MAATTLAVTPSVVATTPAKQMPKEIEKATSAVWAEASGCSSEVKSRRRGVRPTENGAGRGQEKGARGWREKVVEMERVGEGGWREREDIVSVIFFSRLEARAWY